jgi:hypothetical protein
VNNEYAVLSTYASSAADLPTLNEPGSPGDRREVPHLCRTTFGERNIPRNTIAAAAYRLDRPKLTNLWGAGMSFAKCHAERRVPNDERMLHVFDGEEFSRWARFFSWGYDTYTPSRALVFHDYTPVPHHWGGTVNKARQPGEPTLEEEKAVGHARMFALLRMPPGGGVSAEAVAEAEREMDPAGLGPCRSYEQLTTFSGVNPAAKVATGGDRCGQLYWVPPQGGGECAKGADDLWRRVTGEELAVPQSSVFPFPAPLRLTWTAVDAFSLPPRPTLATRTTLPPPVSLPAVVRRRIENGRPPTDPATTESWRLATVLLLDALLLAGGVLLLVRGLTSCCRSVPSRRMSNQGGGGRRGATGPSWAV